MCSSFELSLWPSGAALKMLESVSVLFFFWSFQLQTPHVLSCVSLFPYRNKKSPIQRTAHNPKMDTKVRAALNVLQENSLCCYLRALNQQPPSRYITERLTQLWLSSKGRRCIPVCLRFLHTQKINMETLSAFLMHT